MTTPLRGWSKSRFAIFRDVQYEDPLFGMAGEAYTNIKHIQINQGAFKSQFCYGVIGLRIVH